jgi:hypothetical protein
MSDEMQPQYQEQPAGTSKGSRLDGYGAAIVIAIIALCIGLIAYAGYQRQAVARITAQATQANLALSETRGQVDALSARMNEMMAAEQTRQQRETQALQARRQAVARTRTTAAHRRRVEDPRWKKMQSQLDAQQQAIDSTRKDLSSALDSTRTELSGSIARTHDELVALQRRGERNYYEFDISKNKQFRATGPVGIKLKKANTKHQYADLQLMVDDAQLDKKHVNLYEPVTFLNTDTGVPVQLVIQRIDKNRIHGYVSEPKYRAAQLTASSDSAPQPERKKLELPK